MKAAIFDMDGLLIDSEPLWDEVIIESFSTVGIKLTSELCLETKGFRQKDMISHWFGRFPKKEIDPEAIEMEIVERMINLMETKGKLLEGVNY